MEQKSYYILTTFILSQFIPATVLAQTGTGIAGGDKTGGSFGGLLSALVEFIFGPLLVFLLALAFIAFAWGVFKYFISDAEGDKGAARSLMLWGILGFVLILILFGAVNLLVDFTGLGGQDIQNIPTQPTINN